MFDYPRLFHLLFFPVIQKERLKWLRSIHYSVGRRSHPNAVALNFTLNYVMYVFPFLPLRPRPLIRHTFPEFIRKCNSRHFLKSALLSTQIFAWDHFFSIFSPFLSFSLVSLHFAWCYSYLKKLEAMRNPDETSEARVQSETTSKGRFYKISYQVQSAKINLPLSDLVATTWA